MTDHPLALPAEPEAWAAFVATRCDENLQLAADVSEQLTDGSVRSAQDVLDLWNELHTAARRAGSVASLFSEVHPDEAVRSLCEERERAVSRLLTEVGQDRGLRDVLAAVDTTGLDEDSTRLLRLSLRDFRRAGVDRDDATRERLRELIERQTELSQEFGRNIRDDVRTIRVEPARLDGLPQDWIDAHPVGPDGLVEITTDYPDVIPFRTLATDADARRELTVAFLNRAWPANDALLRELVAARREHATLLGYAGWPDYDAEVKMVGDGDAIASFIDRIAAAAKPGADVERAQLLDRLRQDLPEREGLDGADVPHLAELIRREQFGVDANEVRRYFDFGNVRDGLLDVTGRLFGVRYEARPDVAVWHPEVTAYDVLGDGGLLGRIYLDLHPRPGKYKHAAQFDLVVGVQPTQLPEGALVCNFGRGLIEHSDVVTLFHEFGHLLHHILGGHQRYARFSGVATEWDFVEAPSQMLEEWAWDADVLASFAVDAAGEPIPAALVARMRRARDFGRGYQARTQMFYAALSLAVHQEPTDDLTELVKSLQSRYDAFDYIPGTHFHASFGHLSGYTSGYYTYMWSMVIARDMFSAFDPGRLLADDVAHRYRDRVLVPGGSRDAADLVADFLGRPYGFDSFTAWLGAGADSVA